MKALVIPPETDASGREGDNSESLALFIVYALILIVILDNMCGLNYNLLM